jgi:hypothetical protein
MMIAVTKLIGPDTLRPRDIVGNAEVRKICGGVTRHTLIAWRRTHDFPAPVRKLECGELWDARQVREWWRRRNQP